MVRYFYGVLVLLVFCLYSCHNTDGSSKGVLKEVKESKPDAVSDGAITYRKRCAVCHGNDGAAGIYNAAYLGISTMDDASIAKVLKSGKGAMPSFSNSLNEVQIMQVTSYIKTLRH
ncbi:c-type cytochrome [Mucilaginibacter agri]|uniref:Cytochrome c domain-containing protein n=1 Tax=Mucilaginibacter agri TaxID=2695265 RepID=A0A966DTX6_9SPHI|nr:cytochrome c [Mucilaginibacter agri]NCD69114.1 hypothetical protein [Mucilaginibacter agri]